MTKNKRTGACHCGATFEAKTRYQRSCDNCIAEKDAYQVAHPRPIRNCTKCGAESRECRYGLCPSCHQADRVRCNARAKAWRQESKERSKEKKQAPQDPLPEVQLPEPIKPMGILDDGEKLLQRGIENNDLLSALIGVVLMLNRRRTDDLSKRRERDDEERYNRNGGRYGYGCQLPKQEKEEEGADPEHEDHADQDRIDGAFDDLMKGLDL